MGSQVFRIQGKEVTFHEQLPMNQVFDQMLCTVSHLSSSRLGVSKIPIL